MVASSAAPLPARMWVFIAERFPPAAYLTLICLFVAAGFVPAARWAGLPADAWRYLAAVGATGALFLHLRMFDELKDAAVDRLGRPERPLPRGLVSEAELRRAGTLVLAVGLLFAASLGPGPLAAFVVTAAFVALADFDFGAGRLIHRNLLVYAAVHSPVAPLLLVFAWLAGGATPAAAMAWLALLAWALTVGLEFARKTRAPDEERAYVETYSRPFGQRRAMLLGGGAIALAALAAGGYAMIAAAPAWVIATSLGFAAVVIVITVGTAGRLRQRQTESLANVAGLVVLAWPTAISLIGGG